MSYRVLYLVYRKYLVNSSYNYFENFQKIFVIIWIKEGGQFLEKRVMV